MTVEMSTLRNKRIELLKGMQGKNMCKIHLYQMSITTNYYTLDSIKSQFVVYYS